MLRTFGRFSVGFGGRAAAGVGQNALAGHRRLFQRAGPAQRRRLGADARQDPRAGAGSGAAASSAFAADPGALVTYSKQGKFEDVRDDLKMAIEGKGLVIDYQSYVNRMLERTGKDVGSTKALYAGAEALQFCSAQLSRKMMEADEELKIPQTAILEMDQAIVDGILAYKRETER